MKIICCFLACLFLISGVLLPLGDFTLLRDIPDMYRNYTKITSAEELSVIDFIGDYLMHGRELFGNNEHDKVPANGNSVQFQHRANPLSIIVIHLPVTLLAVPGSSIVHPQYHQSFSTSDYRNKLFRPPLA
ncbi:hypothetical protein [Mucilaginibacter sp.]|uniref:hypothetical protein n=1 Tax=Mucilaginibacter sp. TaxID=1882438 RepID=UPI002625EAA9|nr:hypothetical protein [Mucilaginibacter sp.]